MEVPAILFAISSSRVSLISLMFPMLSSHSCCLLLCHLMLLPVVLSLLRRSVSILSD
jgi:hypothetical protein